MSKGNINKQRQELIKKHYLLLAYSKMSEGGEPLDSNPNLIEDNRHPSPNIEESEGVDYFATHGEMKRYKTKNGVYNGYPITWVLQVTKEGFKALQDEKYLKEYESYKTEKSQTFVKRYWWLLPALTYIAGLFTPAIQKSILQKTKQESIQSKPSTPKKADSVYFYQKP